MKENYLHFTFVLQIVQEFERVNATFQKTNADPFDLCEELRLHHRSLRNRVFDSLGRKKALYEIDFGVKFLTECSKINKEILSKCSNQFSL